MRPTTRHPGFYKLFAYWRAHALGGGGAVNCARSANPSACSILPHLRDGILVAVLAELLALDLLELVLPHSPLVFRSIRLCLYL